MTAAVEALAPWLPGLAGDFAKTAVLAGACVEWGGSPMALANVLPQRAAEAMMLNDLVPGCWAEAAPGRPLPEMVSASTKQLVQVLVTLARPKGHPDKGDMTRIAMSWFDMEDWLKALIAVLGHGPFRAAVPAEVKAELREYAAAVADRSQRAAWVRDLAAVLDDEPLVVLNPRARRAYALTMSGVGDNFQLHILLADRLIGDSDQGLVPGCAPTARGSRQRRMPTRTWAPTIRRSAGFAFSTVMAPTSTRKGCPPTSNRSRWHPRAGTAPTERRLWNGRRPGLPEYGPHPQP